MKNIYRYIVLFFILFNFSKAEAINGLFFSAGLGAAKANIDFEETYSGWNGGNTKDDGLGVSFKLGYGVSEDIAIYFFINSAIVPGENDGLDENSYVNSVLGLGFNYYLDSSKIFYTIAGLGKGQFMQLKDTGDDIIYGENDIYRGDGYMLGLGINLFPNFHLEFISLGTDIDDVVDDKKLKLESTSTQILLNYYWY